MMNYLQMYASLRFREDRSLDAMAVVLTQCALAGLRHECEFQTLRSIGWSGAEESSATITCQSNMMQFLLLDLDGSVVLDRRVSFSDTDTLCAVTKSSIEFIESIMS